MSKILDTLNAYIERGQSFYSFEFFPPKTDEGVRNLQERQRRMVKLGPAFCDITWGAGGSTADVTLEVAGAMQQEASTERLHACPGLGWRRGGPGSYQESSPRQKASTHPLLAACLQIGMNTMMHLTCTNMSIEKLQESLQKVCRLLASPPAVLWVQGQVLARPARFEPRVWV